MTGKEQNQKSGIRETGIRALIPYSVRHTLNRQRILWPQRLARLSHLVRSRTWHFRQALRRAYLDPLMFSFRLYILKHEPIIVYQMGKVGSRSVVESLEARGGFAFHCHSLDTDWFQQDINDTMKDVIYRQAASWRWLARHVVKPGRKAKYITLVRDPIAMNVASFFQSLDENTNLSRASSLPVEEVLERFAAYHEPFYNYIYRWFDEEIRKHLGIDIFEHPFPIETGVQHISHNGTELLVIKLEIDDAIKEKALREFMADPAFTLLSANVGEQKDYADLYREFKKKVRIPADVLDRVYADRLPRHFYSEDEIATLKARWAGKA